MVGIIHKDAFGWQEIVEELAAKDRACQQTFQCCSLQHWMQIARGTWHHPAVHSMSVCLTHSGQSARTQPLARFLEVQQNTFFRCRQKVCTGWPWSMLRSRSLLPLCRHRRSWCVTTWHVRRRLPRWLCHFGPRFRTVDPLKLSKFSSRWTPLLPCGYEGF